MNSKLILVSVLAGNLLFSCVRNQEKQTAPNRLSTNIPPSSDTFKAIGQKIGYDDIKYYPNSKKDWRKAWAFYQKLPELLQKNGINDSNVLKNMETHTLAMLVSPIQYAVFINREQPTNEEALAIIDAYHQHPILSSKSKALIYAYLLSKGLQDEANKFAQKTLDRGVPISQNNTVMQEILAEKERFPPKNTAKDGRIQQEYDYKITALKNMLGK